MSATMNFVDIVNAHGITMPKGAPPIVVAHPLYGALGTVNHRGFVPPRGRWWSTRAILRDADRAQVKRLRKIEDVAPKFVTAAIIAALTKDPLNIGPIFGAISTYDGIVSARGGQLYQDYWMMLTTAMTPVSTVWHDTWKMTWTPGAVPSVTTLSAGTGGAVMDAASNGSWIANPAGSNKRYIVSCGLSVTSLSGLSLAMLVDNLWAGGYTYLAAGATVTVTAPVNTTRYTGTGSAGNMLMQVTTTTLTYTGTATITITYSDPGGVDRTLITVLTTAPLTNRVIGNTTYNTATVLGSTPFHSLSNAGSSGVKNLHVVSYPAITTVTSAGVDFKIVRPLIVMPFIAAGSYIEQDTTLNIGNMVELVNVSQVCGCLSWVVLAGAGTTACTMSAFLRTVEG